MTEQPVIDILEVTVEQALREVDWQVSKFYLEQVKREKQDVHLTLVLENPEGIHRRRDIPLNFELNNRQYAYRYIEYLTGEDRGVTVYKAAEGIVHSVGKRVSR